MRLVSILSFAALVASGCAAPAPPGGGGEEVDPNDKSAVLATAAAVNFIEGDAEAEFGTSRQAYRLELEPGEAFHVAIAAGEGSLTVSEERSGSWEILDCEPSNCALEESLLGGTYLIEADNFGEASLELTFGRGFESRLATLAADELFEFESVAQADGGLFCDVVRGGTVIAAGATVMLGVGAVACAEIGGVATVATAGAGATVAVPVCGVVAAGALAAGVTTLAFQATDTLICQGGLQLIVDNVRAATAEAVEVLWNGTWWRLPCKMSYYVFLRAQKDFWCSMPRSCRDQTLNCVGISARIFNGTQCAAMRKAKQVCWGANADRNHIEQTQTVIDTLAMCITRYGINRCGTL